MPPKRSQYNNLQHNLWNAALMLQNFHINSPYGRLGEHLPHSRWEAYVEKFQYNQEFGSNRAMRAAYARARQWGPAVL
jgi:hypothetical protein